jgi:tetratricopeptide (TPR) repeat protein
MADIYLQATAVRPDQRAVLLEDFNERELHSQIAGFNKTLEMYPQDPWSREGLAACYLGLGNTGEAIRLLEERLAIGQFTAHALVALGMACQKAGDNARGEELCRQALSMDDAYPLAWLGLARSLDGQANTGDAEAAYRRAFELAPAFIDAHLGLADNLFKRNRLDEAATVTEVAISASPDNPQAHLKLAEIRARQKQFDDSLRELLAARELAPYTHPPKVLLAVYRFQNGELDRAKELLQQARAEMPDHPVPHLFLGQFALLAQQRDDARKHLAAADSSPLPDNWPASHKKRFQILLQTERLKLAQQLQDASLAHDAAAKWLEAEPESEQARKINEDLRAAEGN